MKKLISSHVQKLNLTCLMQRRQFLTSLLTSTAAAAALPLTAKADSPIENTPPTSESLAKSRSTELDLTRLLSCIAQVETGNKDDKIGRKGERSKYQLTEAVYKQHVAYDPNENFKSMCTGRFAEQLALKHLKWLHMQFGDDVYWLAFAWHTGASFAKKAQRGAFVGRLDPHDYATRVLNLYNDSPRPRQVSDAYRPVQPSPRSSW